MRQVTKTLFEALAGRRSFYQLSNESTIPDSGIEDIVQKVLLNTPSAFNTQTSRIVVLLGDQHRKLWDIVKGKVLPHVASDAEKSKATEGKLNGFQGAYGSILFFEDPKPFEPLQGIKMYADKYGDWGNHTNGMHQLLVWTALEAEGMGANLQHYNTLIDEDVAKTWSIDPSWKLLAQMVIGKPVGDHPAPKEKKPVEDRYRIIS